MGTGDWLIGKHDKMLRITCDGQASHPGVVATLLVTNIAEFRFQHQHMYHSLPPGFCLFEQEKYKKYG